MYNSKYYKITAKIILFTKYMFEVTKCQKALFWKNMNFGKSTIYEKMWILKNCEFWKRCILKKRCIFKKDVLFFHCRKISKLFRNDKRDTITTVIQCFGGGLLLGTALILILPEVSLSNQSNFDSSYIQPYYYETSVLGQPNPQWSLHSFSWSPFICWLFWPLPHQRIEFICQLLKFCIKCI